MLPDGADLRFAETCMTGQLEYWIQDYINTDSTIVWVKVPLVSANDSVTIMMIYGNPTANDQSDISMFEGPFSGNDSITGGLMQGAPDRQRGFFFYGRTDILVTKFGKYEPNGSTRYLTLFDSLSQGLIEQIEVSGPANTLSYGDLNKPRWLNKDQSYLITVHLGVGDNYYNSSGNTQTGPYLTYTRTGWCNSCDQNTFPTNSTIGHFGYPDFEYYVRDSVSVYPSYQLKAPINAMAGPDFDICEGNLAQLNGAASGGDGNYSYLWEPTGPLNNPGIPNPIFTATGSGNLVFGVLDGLFCVDYDTLVVSTNPLPVVDLGGDTLLCGGSVSLDAGPGMASYLWSDASTGQMLVATIPGLYYVTVVDAQGCEDSDSVMVDVCVSLDDSAENGIKLIPNPSSEGSKLMLDRRYAAVSVSIVDVKGRVVSSHQYNGVNSIDLNVSGLVQGVYMVQVSTEDGLNRSLRMVRK
jgi:hypothetical protein